MSHLRGRAIVMLVLATTQVLAAPGRAGAQRSTRPAETPVAYVPLDASTLRLPTTGYATITNERAWRALWKRYDTGGPDGAPTPVPVVDFDTKIVLVVSLRSGWCTSDSIFARVFVRSDTLQVMSSRVHRACSNSSAATGAIIVDRPSRPVHSVVNSEYSSFIPLPEDPWTEHRTLADLDTVAEPTSRAGWLEQLAREDTSVANLRRLADATQRVGGASVLLAMPRTQRDSMAVRTLMMNGGAWTSEATRFLIQRRGRKLVSDPRTDGGTLQLMVRYLDDFHEPSALAAAIYDHPAIARDTALRREIAASGALPGGGVFGVVRDAKGQARPGVAVVAAVGLRRESVSDQNGLYWLVGLPPGAVHITARLNPSDSADTTITVIDRKSARWDPVITGHSGARPPN